MKLTKTCRFLVRVRDYETAHIEVGAEISHFDIGYDNEAWAKLPATKRDSYMEDILAILNEEVDRLAREEMETVSKWSEISPNLAEDYLSAQPPARMQRNQHAKTTTTHSPSTGGLRRRKGAAPQATPARPRTRRPA